MKKDVLIMDNKYSWIINYINDNGAVDILNSDFVDAYIEHFSANYKATNYGANKCPELSKLLSGMHKKYMLRRSAVGLTMSSLPSGFPKWVYVFKLNQ